MDREELREYCLGQARQNKDLVERHSKQYWVFFRSGHDPYEGPLLVISKPGRTVIHVKHVVRPTHARWRFIGPADPTHVGPAYEIRMVDDLADARAAFLAGLEVMLA